MRILAGSITSLHLSLRDACASVAALLKPVHSRLICLLSVVSLVVSPRSGNGWEEDGLLATAVEFNLQQHNSGLSSAWQQILGTGPFKILSTPGDSCAPLGPCHWWCTNFLCVNRKTYKHRSWTDQTSHRYSELACPEMQRAVVHCARPPSVLTLVIDNPCLCWFCIAEAMDLVVAIAVVRAIHHLNTAITVYVWAMCHHVSVGRYVLLNCTL